MKEYLRERGKEEEGEGGRRGRRKKGKEEEGEGEEGAEAVAAWQ